MIKVVKFFKAGGVKSGLGMIADVLRHEDMSDNAVFADYKFRQNPVLLSGGEIQSVDFQKVVELMANASASDAHMTLVDCTPMKDSEAEKFFNALKSLKAVDSKSALALAKRIKGCKIKSLKVVKRSKFMVEIEGRGRVKTTTQVILNNGKLRSIKI